MWTGRLGNSYNTSRKNLTIKKKKLIAEPNQVYSGMWQSMIVIWDISGVVGSNPTSCMPQDILGVQFSGIGVNEAIFQLNFSYSTVYNNYIRNKQFFYKFIAY